MISKQPLSTMALVVLTFALGLGTFIQILDTSIANVAIPYIAGDLAVSAEDGTWVITSFAVSNGIVLPLTGWLASRFGGVRCFIWSTSLFSLASFLCGFAPSFSALVFFRIIQGAVAGSLIPLSQSLLLTHFPEERKGLALGFWSMVVIVAPVVGPILGGWITDNYGWPWIFYINIPLGLLSAFLTWDILHGRDNEKERNPIDIVGLCFLIIGVGSFQVFLDKGQELDWFNSDVINALGISAIVFLTLFTVWSIYTDYPVVNFAFFKDLNFSISTVLSALVYLVFFGTTVLVPLWLQTQQGYTAFKAGVAVMPIGLLPIFIAPILGQMLGRVSLRLMGTISFFIFSITSFWFSNLTTDVSIDHIMLIRFVSGIGVAFFFLPLLTLALTHIDNKNLASASGLYNFIRIVIGGGAGTAIYVTFWSRREIWHHSYLTEAITPFRPVANQAYETIRSIGLEGRPADQFVDNLVANQSYMLAFNDLFWLSGWMLLLIIPFLWLCKEPQTRKPLHAAE
jgi:MFS transporter, DHA2 family, multidrug resistance protein